VQSWGDEGGEGGKDEEGRGVKGGGGREKSEEQGSGGNGIEE